MPIEKLIDDTAALAMEGIAGLVDTYSTMFPEFSGVIASLSSVAKITPDELIPIKEKYKAKEDEIIESIKSDGEKEGKLAAYYAKREEQDNATKIHQTQQATVGNRFITTPSTGSTITEDIPMPDADYSSRNSYPDSQATIDELGSWYKTNSKTNYTEFIHFTGSGMKIDSEGNVELHVRGNLKFVVDGFMYQEVRGEHELYSLRNYKHTVDKDKTEKIKMNKIVDVTENITQTVGLTKNVLVGVSSIQAAGLNTSIVSAVNINIDAGVNTDMTAGVNLGLSGTGVAATAAGGMSLTAASIDAVGNSSITGGLSVSGSVSIGGDAAVGGTVSASNCDCP